MKESGEAACVHQITRPLHGRLGVLDLRKISECVLQCRFLALALHSFGRDDRSEFVCRAFNVIIEDDVFEFLVLLDFGRRSGKPALQIFRRIGTAGYQSIT